MTSDKVAIVLAATVFAVPYAAWGLGVAGKERRFVRYVFSGAPLLFILAVVPRTEIPIAAVVAGALACSWIAVLGYAALVPEVRDSRATLASALLPADLVAIAAMKLVETPQLRSVLSWLLIGGIVAGAAWGAGWIVQRRSRRPKRAHLRDR